MIKSHILVFLGLLLLTQAGFPQIVWDDGLVHNIDSGVFSEPVGVYDSISSQPTIVNITQQEPNPPQITPIPPSFDSGLWLYDNSLVDITGGMINGLYCNDSSQISISGDIFGGAIIANLYSNNSSQISISGGMLPDIQAYGSSQIEITGGGNIIVVTPEGKIPSISFSVNQSSQIIIDGTDFEIDGIGVGYGSIGFSSGVLDGTLSDGHRIFVDFLIADNASIILVPEPVTILLFGIGGLLLRKRS